MRGLASDECGNWLGLLLRDRGDLRTSSHSLKCTLLSYCAKWGTSHIDRLALEGHRHPGDTYSRDALARPLRLLARVIDAVSRELFFPDACRAKTANARSRQCHCWWSCGREIPILAISQLLLRSCFDGYPDNLTAPLRRRCLACSSFDFLILGPIEARGSYGRPQARNPSCP